MIFTCKCCQYTKDFENSDEFEKLDWERIAPVEAFENKPEQLEEIFCNLCPSFYISNIASENHSAVHEHWESMGRPEKFSIGNCLLESDKKRVNRIAELGKILFNGVPISEKKLVSSTLRSIHFGDKQINDMLKMWAERPLQISIW